MLPFLCTINARSPNNRVLPTSESQIGALYSQLRHTTFPRVEGLRGSEDHVGQCQPCHENQLA